VPPGQLRTIRDATGSCRDKRPAGGRMIAAWVALAGTMLGGYNWILHIRRGLQNFANSQGRILVWGTQRAQEKAQNLRQGLLTADVIKLCPGEFAPNRVFVDRYRYCFDKRLR